MNPRTKELLQQLREGTLDDAGRDELNNALHRDEAVETAARQASRIVHRRWSLRIAAVAALLLVTGSGLWIYQQPTAQHEPLAQVQHNTTAPTEWHADVLPTVAEESPALPTSAKAERRQSTPPSVAPKHLAAAPSQPDVIAPSIASPKVMCNSQCDADSVISDIRKFLSV